MEEISPFTILGIEPTDNKYVISSAYRRMVKMVHPDKIRASGLNWSEDECNLAFNRIQTAYKTIKKNYNFADVPENELIYSMEEMNVNDTDFKKFKTVEQFNLAFEKNRDRDLQMGFSDPNVTQGYSNFNHSQTLLTKEWDPTPKNQRLVSKSLVRYAPGVIQGSNDFYEFGLTKIDDFGFNTNAKGSSNLSGSDISQVFEHSGNTETWEESMNRQSGSSLRKKLAKKTVEQLQKERAKLDIDKAYRRSKKHEKRERTRKLEHLHKINEIQNSRDNYHTQTFLQNGGSYS